MAVDGSCVITHYFLCFYVLPMLFWFRPYTNCFFCKVLASISWYICVSCYLQRMTLLTLNQVSKHGRHISCHNTVIKGTTAENSCELQCVSHRLFEAKFSDAVRSMVRFTFFGRPFVKWFALCYRSVVCLSCLSVCLSVLSVTLVYCGQTVRQIMMKLGMQVGLGPGHTMLDGDPAPLPQKGLEPPYVLWPGGWMD